MVRSIYCVQDVIDYFCHPALVRAIANDRFWMASSTSLKMAAIGLIDCSAVERQSIDWSGDRVPASVTSINPKSFRRKRYSGKKSNL